MAQAVLLLGATGTAGRASAIELRDTGRDLGCFERAGSRMTALAIKQVGKQLTWSVQTDADQTESPAKHDAETRKRAQAAHQMPEPWQRFPKRLDPCATQRHDAEEGIPLGECRFNQIGSKHIHTDS